eukprot:4758218-Pyramimonas_sp.AAC.1
MAKPANSKLNTRRGDAHSTKHHPAARGTVAQHELATIVHDRIALGIPDLDFLTNRSSQELPRETDQYPIQPSLLRL